jgi:hypothetical protein
MKNMFLGIILLSAHLLTITRAQSSQCVEGDPQPGKFIYKVKRMPKHRKQTLTSIIIFISLAS